MFRPTLFFYYMPLWGCGLLFSLLIMTFSCFLDLFSSNVSIRFYLHLVSSLWFHSLSHATLILLSCNSTSCRYVCLKSPCSSWLNDTMASSLTPCSETFIILVLLYLPSFVWSFLLVLVSPFELFLSAFIHPCSSLGRRRLNPEYTQVLFPKCYLVACCLLYHSVMKQVISGAGPTCDSSTAEQMIEYHL